MDYEKPDTGPAILDRVEAGHRQADAEAAMATAFVDAAMAGDLTELAPWAPMRTARLPTSYKRHATVGEVLTDSLDYSKGPQIEDLIRIVCEAASGQDQQAQAKALIGRMAQAYAKYNAEADDE